MFYNHTILKVNDKDILYLYLEPTYEFAKDFHSDNKQESIYHSVTNYINNKGIKFNGKNIYLVVNGIIVSSIIINQPITLPGNYKYVEILRDYLEDIELLDEENFIDIKTSKFIDLNHSDGILEKVYLEDYIFGVVAAEIPISFGSELKCAQAILARTYALKELEKGHSIKDLNTTQIFRDKKDLQTLWKENYDIYTSETKNTIKKTKGLVLTYNDNYIDVYTHMVNHGKTEDARDSLYTNIPYLVSVNSEGDLKDYPFTETKSFTYQEISTILNQNININTPIVVESRTRGGRVKLIRLGKYRYRGDYLAHLLRLRSTDFTAHKLENKILITILASGMGLGMSIYGANKMAEEGASYQEILQYYFPNTEIKKIS
ncbi:MAG: SpoIID/LytB domain-containing protein [Bacilli bacterium]